MTMRTTLRREARVALSVKAQPVWFRIVKWIVLLGLGALLWRSAFFWWLLLGALMFGIGVHSIWRWKTKAWTQPWGGWNDIEAGRPKPGEQNAGVRDNAT